MTYAPKLALVALLLGSCASHTREECASIDVHLEDEERDVVSMLFVIDPHIPSTREETLLNGLMWGVRMLMTGDLDGDGVTDSLNVDVLRVAVITTDGTSIQTEPAPTPPRPRSFAPDEEGTLSIWPRTSHAWDAWFEAALYRNVHDALAEPVGSNTPIDAAERFLRAHPSFDSPRVIVVATDRDDESLTDPILQAQALRRELRGQTNFALIGAAPDDADVANGDYRSLLRPQPFDETHVRCGDASEVGQYPRVLLQRLSLLANQEFGTALESLCAEPHDFVNYTQSLVLRRFGCCLPTPLSSTADGLVDCRVNVLLPVFGNHHCTEFGLALTDTEDDGNGFLRERCVLPQISHPPGVAPTTEFGFFYDDFTPRTSTCVSPQRIAEAAPLPNGVRFDVHCNIPCPGDAGLVDAR